MIVIGDDGPIPMATLVAEWVRYEYDLYTSPQGEHYLFLMLKLANAAEVDVAILRRLNCSEPEVNVRYPASKLVRRMTA